MKQTPSQSIRPRKCLIFAECARDRGLPVCEASREPPHRRGTTGWYAGMSLDMSRGTNCPEGKGTLPSDAAHSVATTPSTNCVGSIRVASIALLAPATLTQRPGEVSVEEGPSVRTFVPSE